VLARGRTPSLQSQCHHRHVVLARKGWAIEVETWFGLDTWMWIAIEAAAFAVVVAVLIAAIGLKMQSGRHQHRTRGLRTAFGPEYERTVSAKGQSAAEDDLDTRTIQAASVSTHQLSSIEGEHYSEAWAAAQARFVDDPAEAVTSADRLVMEVLQARGYPATSFDDAANAVSVDHPRVVVEYHAAHDAMERSQHGSGETEDLREAMVRYRTIFAELLDVRQTGTTPPQPSAAA
jgi:hypothetical protein